MSRAAKLFRLLAVLLALVQVGTLAYTLFARLRYPFDLEWMEGGMLCHALRFLDGKPLYAAPSVDFIPFLYTPLYPFLLSLLARLFGLGYALGRVVSIGAYVLASVLAYRYAATRAATTPARAAAFAAMALPAAAYALTGSFYDLARPDALWLVLSTGALLLLYHAARDTDDAPRPFGDRRGHLYAALAGALFVLAFLTKQTASTLMLAGGAALVVLNFRFVPAYALALAVLGLPVLLLENHASGGWFYTYVYKLHQGHDFYPRRAFVETPMTLLAIVGPALLLVPWAVVRRASAPVLYAAFLALVGMGTACVASGTQWAITNAYIPGVFFPALAIGVSAGALLGGSPGRPTPRLRPVVVYALLAASLLCKLPGWHHEGDDAFLNLSRARLVHRFDPRRFIPTDADRATGAALVETLRAAPGEVLVPFHPYYAHLAGKRTYVHQMGVMDVGRAGYGVPAGLAEAIREHRFSLVVLDDKIADKWPFWPGLRAEYIDAAPLLPRGPRVPTGAQTVPAYRLVPRSPNPAAGPAPDTAPVDEAP